MRVSKDEARNFTSGLSWFETPRQRRGSSPWGQT